MKLVKNIILLTFIFLSTLCASAKCIDNFCAQNHIKQPVIVINTKNHNAIDNQKNISNIIAATRSCAPILNNKNQNQTAGSSSEHVNLINAQRKNLLKYIQHQSYQNRKQKYSVLCFLTEIQPNAP